MAAPARQPPPPGGERAAEEYCKMPMSSLLATLCNFRSIVSLLFGGFVVSRHCHPSSPVSLACRRAVPTPDAVLVGECSDNRCRSCAASLSVCAFVKGRVKWAIRWVVNTIADSSVSAKRARMFEKGESCSLLWGFPGSAIAVELVLLSCLYVNRRTE